MLITGEQIVAPGGPSAPAWAFFTAITLAVLGILGQQLAARVRLKELQVKAEEASENAIKAAESANKVEINTAPVSNGFAQSTSNSLKRIENSVDNLNEALRDHLEWHLNQKEKR